MAAQDDKCPGVIHGLKLAPITLHDSNVQAFKFVAIHNNTATGGTVAITDDEDTAVTLYLAAGQVISVRPKLIKATGTTVATLVGFKL